MLYWVLGMHPVHPPSHYPLAGPAGLAPCHEKLIGEALLAFLSRPGSCCENELLVSAAETGRRNKVGSHRKAHRHENQTSSYG